MTDRDPLQSMRPTRAPEELRAPVLDAARQALLATPTESIWERLFRAPALRRAWVATCSILGALHLALTAIPPDAASPGPLHVESAEIRELIALPRQESDVQLGFGESRETRATEAEPAESSPLDEGVPS